jgi:hypothetical protein
VTARNRIRKVHGGGTASVPVVGVEARAEEEGDGEEPRVGVDRDEGEPVATVHAVAGKIDPQRGLRHLGRHLFRRRRYIPGRVGEAVQAQILLLCTQANKNPDPVSPLAGSARTRDKLAADRSHSPGSQQA